MGQDVDRIVECVPNFSEGRNQTTVRALVHAVESVPGVWLLDQTMDRDHHRSVLSFAGEPDAVVEAAFRALRAVARRDDAGLYPSGEAIGTAGGNRAGDPGIPLRTSGPALRSCPARISPSRRASRPCLPHGLRSGLDTGFWS